MAFWVAILAAVGCAICNGIAVVLQKSGADNEAKASSLHAGILLRLLRNPAYVTGIAIDVVAWGLTLVAVHSLPLFVVQPITAFSVVVTLLIERFFFKRHLKRSNIAAIGIIVIGLLLLATTASAETSQPVSETVKLVIIGAPVLLAAAGALVVSSHKGHATAILAGLSGVGFGGTALVGRMLHIEAPYWQILIDPLFIAMLGYGLVGILLFTIALQRHHASVVNAVMITAETLAPALVGLIFLGDHPKPGLWPVMVAGCSLAVVGILMLTSHLFSRQPANTIVADEAGA